MYLIYVTGISGSGKSTICKSLHQNGFESYDIDKDGIAMWFRRSNGSLVDITNAIDTNTPKWFSANEWRMSREKVEYLAHRAVNKTIFLCGSTGNDGAMWDLFDKMIYLVVDESTIRQRITSRTDNDFGKAPHEMAHILKWYKKTEDDYRKFGARMIDANRPIDIVTQEIIDVLS